MMSLLTFKKSKFVLTILIASLLALSCEKDDAPLKITEDGSYTGKLVVDQLDGTNFSAEGIKVNLIPSETDGYLTIEMLQVSFSSRMPIKLDMKIPNVIYISTSEKITLSGNNIIPIAMGGEFPAYTITNLTGELKNGTLSLSMMCGSYPLTYSGSLLL